VNDVFERRRARRRALSGRPTQFEEAMAEFAMAYTDQTERERRAFVDAIKGRSDQRVDAGALPRKRDRSIWSRRACVRSAAANDRAFGSEADGALPGRPDGGAFDLDGTLTPAPDAMAEAKTSLRDPARSCATRARDCRSAAGAAPSD
jgi:hypothetical protein